MKPVRLSISAGSFYELYVNGSYSSRGSARCTPHHQSYDVVDIADADNLINLHEYALGGDPTNGTVDAHMPVFRRAGSVMEYVHAMRTNDIELVYELELTGDLADGLWINTGYTVTETNGLAAPFIEITNAIPAGDPHKFIRLKVQ